MEGYKIFIIEDDKIISESIQKHLEKWGYQTKSAEDFKEILVEVSRYAPDLILLDISLPFYNGFYWCGEIRKLSKVPIIFISSADDNMNIVMAMEMGGDDFVAKPFDLTVLTAKINAMIRRSYSYKGNLNILEAKGVILNLSTTILTFHDKKVELTKNELKILQLLMEKPGEVISRDTIMTHLWESDSFVDDNTLTVNVTRIRKKLLEIGVYDFIKTKKGIGYYL